MEEMHRQGIVVVRYNGKGLAEERGSGEKTWSFQALSRHSTLPAP